MPKSKTVNSGVFESVRSQDLVSLSPGKPKDFSWHNYIKKGLNVKEYPGKYEPHRTHYIHSFIIRRFNNLIIKDVIDNNVQFDFNFNSKVFLSLLIADRDKESYVYRYKISNRGHDFIPFCKTSPLLWGRTHRYFLFSFSKEYRKYFNQQVSMGHEYEPAPKIKYKKKRQYGLQLRIYKSQGRGIPDSEKVPLETV